MILTEGSRNANNQALASSELMFQIDLVAGRLFHELDIRYAVADLDAMYG